MKDLIRTEKVLLINYFKLIINLSIKLKNLNLFFFGGFCDTMHCAVQSADDGSIPGATHEEKVETYKYWQCYNLDNYYESTKHLTFDTTFIPLTKEEVQALVKELSNPSKLTEEQKEVIKSISMKIDEAITKYNGKAFVKLASRSPKDAADKLPHILPILKKELEKQDSTHNGEFIAMRYSLMEAMAVDSAKSTFDLFAYSSRIISDIQRVQ